MEAIIITNLKKTFGDIVAVNDFSLTIKENEIFSLLGVNGAGKTTIINILTGLIKPSAGKVSIFGYDLETESDQIKPLVNVSPQETAIAPNLTVKENLLFIAEIYGIDKKTATKQVAENITKFGLTKYQNKRAKILSGGYQRRLAIAMALISNPKLLFLDEPTLGLDVLARRELWAIITALKGQTTIVLTTHYMEEDEGRTSNCIGNT